MIGSSAGQGDRARLLHRVVIPRPWILATNLTTLLGLTLNLLLVFNMTQLRPIADDYCFSSKVTMGFIPAIRFWFERWMGDLTSITLNSALIGLPVLHLPWSVSSTVSRIAAGCCIFSLTVLLYRCSLLPRARQSMIQPTLLLGSFSILAWYAYWWVRTELFPVDFTADISEGSPPLVLAKAVYEISALWITHSSNINAQYIVGMGIGALLILLTVRLARSSRTLSRLTALVAGVFIGFSGPVMAVSYLITGAVLLVLPRPWRNFRKLLAWPYAMFAAASVAALIVSNQSPGTRIRLERILGDDYYSTITFHDALANPGYLLTWTFPRALQEWSAAAFSAGTVAVLTIGVVVGFLMQRSGQPLEPIRLRDLGLGLVAFSLMVAVVNRLSEAFSYVGIWHQIYSSQVLFFGLLMLGLWLGGLLGVRSSDRISVIVAGPLVVASAVMLIVTLGAMTASISNRAASWERGSAPLPRIPDTSQFDSCWIEIEDYRGFSSQRFSVPLSE